MNRVIVVDTYIPDKRFSMYLFARALCEDLSGRTDFSLVLLSPNQKIVNLFAKILNKFFLFPIKIYMESGSRKLVHLCDTSHAVFLNILPIRAIVTVHDLGVFAENGSTVSTFQKMWRYLLVRGLRKSEYLICVSSQSFDEVIRYVGEGNNRKVILNSTYQKFPALNEEEITKIFYSRDNSLNKRRFVLHIGSNLSRKNRVTLARAFAKIQGKEDMLLVFAGRGVDDDLKRQIDLLGISDLVVSIENPSTAEISALYRRAEVFVFPSTYEGFGIPVVEAQMCGCPVICSNIPPHLEILSGTGIVVDPYDVDGIAKAIDGLRDSKRRGFFVQSGKLNGARFLRSRMTDEYAALYNELFQ